MNMEYNVHILDREQLNHNVVRLTLERPENYFFEPGQAIDFKLNRPQVKDKVSPFTFTGLNSDKHLQLTIKCYPDHHGITEQVAHLKKGDEVTISEPFETVKLRGAGVFIAGGTGITPFIAILRQKKADNAIMGNTLFHFNRTKADTFMEEEFRSLLGDRFMPVLSDQEAPGYIHGTVNAELLGTYIKNFSQPFYTCGPEGFVKAVQKALTTLGADGSMIDVQF